MKKKCKDRIYVCHTYYHVYVTFLKELNRPKSEQGKATLVLSKMSNDFENLKERVEQVGLFEQVLEYDEKRQDEYRELDKYFVDRGNMFSNMIQRIIMTKKFGKLCEKDVPVDFKEYKDIYVFCDADPIGYYLNWKHIPYHAVEDGLNTIQHCDSARFDNRGCFGLKAFLSSKLNLIFVHNGYGKYCIDMEVNDISVLKYSCPKYIEVSRQKLVDHLTQADKKIILKAFVRDAERLNQQIQEGRNESKIMILTEPLCDLQTREQIFRDLITQYETEGVVYLKPHPRDVLDYRSLFPEYPQFDATVPMEVLNFFPDFRVKKVVSVFTEIKAIQFADEVVRLGPDFMDKYESPEIHRENERI